MEDNELEEYDVFAEEETEVEQVEPEEVTKEETEVEDEKGVEAEAESEEEEVEVAESPSEEKTEKETAQVPVGALTGERQRRKLAEQELQQYKAKYESEDITAPDPLDDPQAYKEHVRNQVVVEMRNERFTSSRENMIDVHSDYAKMENLFLVLQSQDDDLVKGMNDSSDPSKFAYDTAKTYLADQKALLKSELLGDTTKKEEPVAETQEQKRKKAALNTPNISKSVSSKPTEEPEEDIFAGNHF